MNRMFGMMPSSEIEIEKIFVDKYGLRVFIQAGPHGWAVIYADGYTKKYNDCDASIEENFEAAKKAAEDDLGKLTEEVR